MPCWPGARINQDNVLWKPPRARPVGFHQDDGYQSWVVPPEMATCWIALDDTHPEGGTLEYARGSHRWGLSPPEVEFHAPDDPMQEMRAAAARAGAEPEIVPVVVPAGGGAFHHGRTYHGSGANRSERPAGRWSRTACPPKRASIRPTSATSTAATDESFFPILWREDGYRTLFLDGGA